MEQHEKINDGYCNYCKNMQFFGGSLPPPRNYLYPLLINLKKYFDPPPYLAPPFIWHSKVLTLILMYFRNMHDTKFLMTNFNMTIVSLKTTIQAVQLQTCASVNPESNSHLTFNLLTFGSQQFCLYKYHVSSKTSLFSCLDRDTSRSPVIYCFRSDKVVGV